MSLEQQSVDRGYRIVHRDEHLLVLEKAHGLLSVPGIGPEKADCLAARVMKEFSSARIVHRLDRDTSGLIVMALDPDTHRELSRQFEMREVAKRYSALVIGHPNPSRGTIDLPIAKDFTNAPRQRIDHEHGRPSVTDFSVTQTLSNPDRARVELRPLTGRSHQLRLHLMTIGHAILGDDLYASPDVRALAPRLCLHADQLAFTHPASRERLSFDSPSPF